MLGPVEAGKLCMYPVCRRYGCGDGPRGEGRAFVRGASVYGWQSEELARGEEGEGKVGYEIVV